MNEISAIGKTAQMGRDPLDVAISFDAHPALGDGILFEFPLKVNKVHLGSAKGLKRLIFLAPGRAE